MLSASRGIRGRKRDAALIPVLGYLEAFVRRTAMSIDYSDMAFPKPSKKKKRKRHKKSILKTKKESAISVPVCMEITGRSTPKSITSYTDPAGENYQKPKG